MAFALFLLVLVVRLAAWRMVASIRMPTVGDETSYWERAQALRRRDWRGFYGDGLWPPLHPAVLAIAPTVQWARLVNVFVASLTAVPLHLLALRLTGPDAARFAVLAFAVYPVFVAFSHLLWSESLFSLLLVTCSYLFVVLSDTGDWRHAALLGTSLGLLGLTRSSALAYAAGFLVLLFAGTQSAPAAVTAACATMLWLPWLVVLRVRQGRWVALCTGNGYNLYLGNNPYLPLLSPDKTTVLQPNADNLGKHLRDAAGIEGPAGIPQLDAVAQVEALAFIAAHPGAFLRRCAGRLLTLLSPDYFVRRHFDFGLYPKAWNRDAFVWANTLGHWLLLPAGLTGVVLLSSHRPLFAVLLVAGFLFPTLSIAPSRLNIPTLVVLTVPFGRTIDWLAGLVNP